MTSAPYPERKRIGKKHWLVILSCATFLALFYAARGIFIAVSQGLPIDWVRRVGFEFLYFYIWALLTPVVILFADRFRINRSNWKRVVPLLILFGLFIAPFQSAFEFSVAYCIDLMRHVDPTEMARRRVVLPRAAAVESFGNFIIYSLIVCGNYAFDYYQKYREREVRSVELEGRLAQAELQNLKMQLQPHFLFNTLHTISVLMMRDTAMANRMLIRLSDLLRITLDGTGSQLVTLKEELEFLSSYLEIEQTRFQDRLQVTIQAPRETLDAKVPNLILQPLVENAIRHGIGNRTTAGTIRVGSVDCWQTASPTSQR